MIKSYKSDFIIYLMIKSSTGSVPLHCFCQRKCSYFHFFWIDDL